MQLGIFTLGLVLTISLGTGTGWTYEEISVTDGGTLTGKITLKGDVPKPKGYNLVTLPDAVYCGRISTGTGWRLLQPFVIGPEGGFKNVVVYLQNIKQGKSFDYTPPLIEAIDCKFEPYISVVRDRQGIKVVNKDPVFHDIQGYETSKRGARVLFNTPLPMSKRLRQKDFLDGKTVKNRAGKVITQPIKMGKGRNLFVMQCGFHAYMESWAFVAANPYYSLSAADGSYSISNIPPGTYKVLVWHPMVNEEFTVTLEAKGTTELPIEIDAPRGRLYANEVSEGTRFGVELLGESTIKPTVELQTY
ncbi:carboxypeptidase regulatory-like domain-containing protein [Candidatus Nitronereus thalassa]|uniref:Carboxypeptidase regulatory-like domain-containing protein n=1 Tax=Candidatus Nitronereus thalassa TaxID=3020898 RepID=A0ABU3K5E0_9BACT|nr:carboxypeptidase regulatory-like domain-containing protein [Candidatus Nitronereus thalassa]MDT7041610.1 carboxypeptidase regulatory-like domain-containing protein [Candidatus Nitronereus thalassa]